MNRLPAERVALAVAIGVGWMAVVSPAALADFPLASDPRIDTSKLRITTFASGLAYPTGMQALGDGSVLVATSVPNDAGSGFYNSSGRLVRLVDADHDGHADGPGTVLFSGLPGSLSAVQKAGQYTVVTSGSPGDITILKDGATPADAMSLVGHVQFAFPADAEHRTYALAAQPIADGHNIYFNVGARFNDAATPDPVPVSGLLTGSVNAGSIYRFSLTGTGGSPTIGNLQQIAAGLRNAAGMAFRTNGDFYFNDDGIDSPSNRNASLSPDELNRIAASDLGNGVPNFGFPNHYTDYATGQEVGSGGVEPVTTFRPINGNKSEGASQIAFSPADFPAGLNNGVFVGFHGKFNAAGVANDENALVFYDFNTGESFDVVLPGSTGIGHFDGLLSTADSLFLSDLNSNGSTGESAPAGVIYQVTAVPEPTALGLGSLISLLTLRRRK